MSRSLQIMPRNTGRSRGVIWKKDRASFFWPLCILGLLCFAPQLPAQTVEYRIKAEFLERFTRFVEWPVESGKADPAEPFRLCVVGANPFGNYLYEMAEEIRIQGRRVHVEYVSSDQVTACNLLFISRSEDSHLNSILKITGSLPILTVGDTEGFAQRGVLINLFNDAARIRFEVNPEAVKRSGLRFSSRLMMLARIVSGK